MDDLLEEDDCLFEPTPEEQAQINYHNKCKQLCQDIGLDLSDFILDFNYSIHAKIIEFLQDEEKLKKALFLLKNQAFI